MQATPRLSLAIPVYNEREVLPTLLERVRGVLATMERVRGVLATIPGGPHEVVMVDDGSSDGTADMLAAAALKDPSLVAVCLSRNFRPSDRHHGRDGLRDRRCDRDYGW